MPGLLSSILLSLLLSLLAKNPTGDGIVKSLVGSGGGDGVVNAGAFSFSVAGG